MDRITPGREARQDAEPRNSELASHRRVLENCASRKRRGGEVKDSSVGVPPGNILCTENGQDDSRCSWGGLERFSDLSMVPKPSVRRDKSRN